MNSPSQPQLSVLIAEDDPALLSILGRFLETWGYRAISARDGAEALAVLCGSDPPPVAILDWGMPNVDGLEVCRRARELRPEQPSYLILLTGRGGREDLIAGLEGGADEYLAKPADPAELRARLQAAWRVVRLQQRLAERVRELAAGASPLEVANGSLQPGLRRTLWLCAATFAEALVQPALPRHLRIALRTSKALCLDALGEGDAEGSAPLLP